VRVFTRLGTLMLLGMALASPATQGQGATPTEQTAQGPVIQGTDWRVEPARDGYRLTLRLTEPVPMRDAMPLLSVDGKPVGIAKQSVDGRILTTVTKDPAVLAAKDVKLIWSTELTTAQRSRQTVRPGKDNYWQTAQRGPVNAVDPGAAGKYGVDVSEYNLGDEVIYLPGLGHRSELRAKVYAPRHAAGPRPLVIFLHGRHAACYGTPSVPPTGGDKPWPCPAGMKPVPSYRGFDAPAEALASHGYLVVSISANAINALDAVDDGGALARAQLVLGHLDLWKRWSSRGGRPYGRRFVGKVDLHNVGLMGHSRGGEDVARAVLLNSELGGRYGIRAVLPLAPTDFTRFTVPGVAMSVLLPYCDGDVVDLQGQKFYDDTRYAVSRDRAPRSTVLVMGTNHNFFNTEWTPGESAAPSVDDWSDGGAPCGPGTNGRLTAKEQQSVERAYVAGFFRLELGREQALMPLFDGSMTRAASAGRAVVRVVAQAPAGQRLDVARLDQQLPAGSVSGSATAAVCAGAGPKRELGTPPCGTTGSQWQQPHWATGAFVPKAPTTAVTKLEWTGTSGVLRFNLAPGSRDVHKYSALTFRASPGPTGTAQTDLSLRVVDGHGHAVVMPVSRFGDALVRLPGADELALPKILLRTVRVPLSTMSKLDLKDIRTVELRTDKAPNGSVFLSDLAFGTNATGQSGPVKLPVLSVADVKPIAEGNSGTRNVDFWVTISRPSAVPVSTWVETNSGFNSQATEVQRRIVFAPGQLRQKVTVSVTANDHDGFDVPIHLVVSLAQQAITGDALAEASIVDDDPEPVLTVGDGVANEVGKEVRLPVKLSVASDKGVLVPGTTHDGTAKLGPDFTAFSVPGVAGGSVFGFIGRGQSAGSIVVKLVDDKVHEPTEWFSVSIGEVKGATLPGPITAKATIVDND
jgi:hypothetical protein